MCVTCGCSGDGTATILDLQTGQTTATETATGTDSRPDGLPTNHPHDHVHHDHHGHAHEHRDHDHENGDPHEHVHADGTRHTHAPESSGEIVALETRILAKNDSLAAKNRAWFKGREILALNLVSSPGSGKTSLLECTIRDLKDALHLFVIEGDQATANDGERIRAAGAAAVQVNTGTGCHLEADMVALGLQTLKPNAGSIVMIENVGNLVCPALFDLGERAKVIILSVTEGEDKPLKYPHMFRAAEIMILNKIDLLPHVDFDVDLAIANARQVNGKILVIQLSARSGQGLTAWYDWLRGELAATRTAAFTHTD
jgi:hydrogenase nickel incorporation protein HypB